MANVSDFIADYITSWFYFKLTITKWESWNPLKLKNLFVWGDWQVNDDCDGATSCGGVPFSKFGFVLLFGYDAWRENSRDGNGRLGFEFRHVDE